MKKVTKSFCSLLLTKLLLLSLVLGFTSCGKNDNRDKTLRIGVAVYQQDDTFISTIVQNLERMAREEEASREIKINLTILDGQSNQTVQLEQINRMLEQGCNVLCVNIVDRTAAAVLIDKAQKENIPLIFFNRQPVEEDMKRWEQVYYVGVDAAQSGLMQGEIVRDLWESDKALLDKNGDDILQYIMLEGEQGHQDTLLRTQYATKALNTSNIKLEKLASQSANWKRGEAVSIMDGYIAEFGDKIEAVFANNDDMALGAADSFTAAKMELPVIVGVDATPPALEAIKNGTLKGTVLNDSTGIAKSMLELAVALYSEENILTVVELVDEHYVWLPCNKLVP